MITEIKIMINLQSNTLVNTAYALLILIIMLFIDYFLGNILMGIGNSYGGILGLTISLMITFVLFFGTFIIPILIITEHPIMPTNMLLGIGSLLIGIPAVVFIFQTVGFVVENFLGTGDYAIIGNLLMLLIIIAVGVIMPIFIMLKPDPVLGQMLGGEQ